MKAPKPGNKLNVYQQLHYDLMKRERDLAQMNYDLSINKEKREREVRI